MGISFGSISYGVAAAAFAALTLLLAPTVRAAPRARWLMAATFVSAVWAGVLVFGAARNRLPFLLVYLVEMLHDAAWLAMIVLLARAAIPRLLVTIAAAAWVALAIAGVVVSVLQASGVLVGWTGDVILARSGLLLSLLGLVLLEQAFRNTPLASRRQLSYLILGVGGMFAYDLFLYSQAELLRGIELDAWNARGLLYAALAPLLVLAVRRNPSWSLEIFVSRQVVFYTGIVVAVSVYLLLMALGGFYVREFGGAWGRIGQILFFSGAVAILLTLVFSEALRRYFKVAIGKHFFKNKYDYRIEWLRFIATLSNAAEQDVGRRSLQAVTQIFACPGGVLYLLDDAAKNFAPTTAWPANSIASLPSLPADHSLAAFLGTRRWVIDTAEYREHPERYEGMELPRWLNALSRARIVCPILELERLIGFMALDEPPAPFELTYEDRDLLKTVSRHVATHIVQQQASRRLIEGRQLEAYSRLTAFVMHDLKNAVAQLRLLTQNATRHRGNPAFFDDAMSTIANTVERMTRLIEQLRAGTEREQREPVRVLDAVRDAVARCGDRQPAPRLHSILLDENALVQAHREQLTNVVEHVLRNAQDATQAQQAITVTVEPRAGSVEITVADQGAGMDADFVRERLFRPFDTTKGSRGMGIGAYQAREYILSLGGAVNVQSTPEKGTRFSLSIPLRTLE